MAMNKNQNRISFISHSIDSIRLHFICFDGSAGPTDSVFGSHETGSIDDGLDERELIDTDNVIVI